MERCIASISVNGALRTKFRAIADAGFEYVEVFENDLLSSPEPAAVIGAMMRDLGLTCVAFQPFRDFEGMPAAMRGRVFDRAERKFDVLAELGTDLMLVSSNASPDSLSDRARIVDDFRELGERATRRGVRIAFEALPWARHVRDHRDAWQIVREVNHPAVGLALDAFSSLAPGIPCESLEAIDVAKVFHVQIADAPRLAMDAQSWSRHFRCMPGQGELPLVEFVSTLRRLGYAGVLSLEIFNDRFRAGSTAEIALDGMRSLDYLLEQVERRSAAGAVPDERIACSGVEFIEFSAGEEEARQLGQMLRTLGFAPTHRHVRKAVTRWRQGDINIVVNCEPEGFAHSYGTVHGASVCAIGLRVADPAAALQRAHRLQVQSFSQPVGPGEYEIPALRAVGGSLIYLMPERETPSIWRDEFAALPPDPTVRDAGLKRVDHFSQNMQYEEMLSWLLYYLTLFQVDKSAATEIADPVGTGAKPGHPFRGSADCVSCSTALPPRRRSSGVSCMPMEAPACNTCPSPPTTSWRLHGDFVSSEWRRCPSPRTTTTTWALATASTTPCCRAWPNTTSFTTRTSAAPISICTRAPSPSASFSKSCSAVNTTVMVPATPPSAWPPNHDSAILRPAWISLRCTHPGTRTERRPNLSEHGRAIFRGRRMV